MLSQGTKALSITARFEEAKRHAAIMSALPCTFYETLREHMNRLKITQEMLSDMTNIAIRTIQRWAQDAPPRLETVVCICLVMRLDYLQSIDLLTKAGLLLRNSDAVHVLYAKMIQDGIYYDLETINTVFHQLGLKLMGGRSAV